MKINVQSCGDIIVSILAYISSKKRKSTQENRELTTYQVEKLIKRMEGVLEEYLVLSRRIREMHKQMSELRVELAQALEWQCTQIGCPKREKSGHQAGL